MFSDFCKPHDDELNKIISSAYIGKEMGVPFNLTGSLSIRSNSLERSSIYILMRRESLIWEKARNINFQWENII